MNPYDYILSRSDSAIIIIDANVNIVVWNKTAEEILGLRTQEVLGKNFFQVLNKIDKHIPKIDVATPLRNVRNDIVGAIIIFHNQVEQREKEPVAMVTHQLRAPLTAMRWTIEALLEGNQLSGSQREKIQDIYRSNHQLINLVNDLLDISKVKAGVKAIKVDIREIIRKTIKFLEPSAKKKNQEIVFETLTIVEKTDLDPALLSKAVENILDNSISYGAENSEIRIEISKERPSKKAYLISIHNEGAAIPKEEQEKLFTKFYRGEAAKQLKPDGSGLGLYIAKSAVEANGGRIWLESPTSLETNTGTTFYFTAPMV